LAESSLQTQDSRFSPRPVHRILATAALSGMRSKLNKATSLKSAKPGQSISKINAAVRYSVLIGGDAARKIRP